MSAAAAAELVRDRDTLAIPLGPGQPGSLLHALGEREHFDELRVFGALLVDFYPLFTRSGVKLLSGFFGPVERMLLGAGHDVEFVPADFRRFASIARRLSPRVMATNATPPDRDGRLSLSLHAGATLEELHAAGRDPKRILIVETNEALPRTLGLPPEHPHSLHVDEIDILIESDREIFILPDAEPSDVEHRIAEHASPFILDGATLQTGIGGIPNAVMSILAKSAGGDYGIHSEMFTTGLMRLHQAGKVSNRKGHLDGLSICTFAGGTRELYDWLDGNEEVRFLPVDQVNDPGIIAGNRRFVSINGALSVDLFGQIAADTLGGIQFSGIGGHEDFVAGAAFSDHGRSLVCLPATAKVGDQLVSRIVTALACDTLVTTPRHQADVVITEYGSAELAGRTVGERAEALAAIAHPDMRDSLAKQEAGVASVSVGN
ncbi:MAG: 4-hydroxybutyrate CoA-transferase [Deltaproteobacteria bacterium]|nr:4-hydroxybutyrate CoA-transferase [Deltaproteobacteria bacterium]MBW2385521.1 4-hydroxybutyrate CoA-transferase [Deltaproteobacteria bacterium]MBW2698953.1 4-hydroxybutyrate CoA-transferase [Deltaproteobacteria bacterium]